MLLYFLYFVKRAILTSSLSVLSLPILLNIFLFFHCLCQVLHLIYVVKQAILMSSLDAMSLPILLNIFLFFYHLSYVVL
jgi:hypothetical protein